MCANSSIDSFYGNGGPQGRRFKHTFVERLLCGRPLRLLNALRFRAVARAPERRLAGQIRRRIARDRLGHLAGHLAGHIVKRLAGRRAAPSLCVTSGPSTCASLGKQQARRQWPPQTITATQLSANTDCKSSGSTVKMSPICVNPMPTASDSAAMRDVALREARIGDHLEAAHDDVAEHHDRATAEHRLGQRGEHEAHRGYEPREHQHCRPRGDGATIHHAGHGHKPHVLREGGDRRATETARQAWTRARRPPRRPRALCR